MNGGQGENVRQIAVDNQIGTSQGTSEGPAKSSRESADLSSSLQQVQGSRGQPPQLQSEYVASNLPTTPLDNAQLRTISSDQASGAQSGTVKGAAGVAGLHHQDHITSLDLSAVGR